MRGMKSILVMSTIVAVAALVGACRKEVPAQPMKLGADVSAVETAR